MIVATSRFRATEQQASELVAKLQARMRRVDTHEGFLGLEVLRSLYEVVTE